MKFPTIEQVNNATKLELAQWVAGLPDNISWEQEPVMDHILFRFYTELDGWTPELKKAVNAGTRFNAVMHLN